MKDFKSFDDLIVASAPKIKKVDTTKWLGAPVYVKEFDGEALGIFISLTQDKKNKSSESEMTATVCALALCTKDGTLMVQRKDIKTAVESLLDRNAQGLNAISMAALTVSGLTGSELEEAGNV